MITKSIKHTIAAGLLCCAVGAALTACTDTWDDHYEATLQGAHEGTLWQALKNNSNFSNFASVLEACGYDKSLASSQVFTVFAPTNDQFGAQEAQTLINSYNSQKGSVSDEDNTVVKEFVRNHIALYNHSVSPSTNDTLVMMNGKYASLSATAIAGAPIVASDVNGLYSNGVLYTVGKQVAYGPNVFEYLRKDNELDSVASFLYNSRFYRREFQADQSVPGGLENGKTVYLDSVFTQVNELFGSQFLHARLSAEDSTYWMLAPTNQVWKQLIDEYQQYFVYDKNVADRDSIAYTNSRLAILQGAVFSRTMNGDAALRDSAMSTSAVPASYRAAYWGAPFLRYYQFGDGTGYSSHKPLEPGGVLNGTTNVECSNGVVMKASQWNISPLNTFNKYIMVNANGRGSIKELSKVWNASRKDYDETVEAVPVTVLSGTPYYNQLIGGNSFMEFKPGNDTTSVTFNIRNVMSNMGYDIYIVTPPALAVDAVEPPRKRSRAAARKKSGRHLAISVGVIVLVMLLWTVFSLTGQTNPRTVPSIQSVLAALASITLEGYKGSTLAGHLGASLFRLFTAFFLAIVTAVPLGLLSGHSAKIRAALEPVVEFVRPLPPLAYYTLLVLWMGIGDGSKIMLLYLACFAPIYVACVSSVTKIPASYLNTASTLGANSSQVFWRVILPYSAADIFTGIRTAIGHGYSTLVAAEMVAASSGIGWMVLDAGNWLRSDVIRAGGS